MGYLVTEIIVLLVAAALIGVVLGWALFGVGKQKKGAAQGASPADNVANLKALTEVTARAAEAEGRAGNLAERIEALEKELAEAKTTGDTESSRERIAALEGQLRSRDAELAAVSSGASGEVSALELMQVKTRLEEKTTEAETLRREFDAYKATGGKLENVLVVEELQAEIAELKATLSSSGGADDASKAELTRLTAERSQVQASLDELKDDHEADQQALEEQDAAIDKLTRELVAAQQRIAELEGTTLASPPARQATLSSAPAAVQSPAPVAEVVGDEDDDGETIAVSLEQLVAAGASRPAAPLVLPDDDDDDDDGDDDDDDDDESTVAIDLSQLVGKVDATTEVGLSRAPVPVSDDEEDSSTVALALSNLSGFLDNSATLQQSRPTGSAPEDLKLIKGIGPVSETRLNEYGITTYRALAALSEEEISVVADYVKMSLERVRPWVEQARELVEG